MAGRSAITDPMNRLTTDRRAAMVASLVEGNSVRATARMTDTAFNTVLKFVVDIGNACAAFYDQSMRNLDCQRLQCDEIWQFCYAKDKNVPEAMRPNRRFGSADARTKTSWARSGRGSRSTRTRSSSRRSMWGGAM